MKLRRPQKPVELGTQPLDAEDAYLLSRLDSGEMTLVELSDLSEETSYEVEVRVERLLALGLIEEVLGSAMIPLGGADTPPDLALDFCDDEDLDDLSVQEWPCPEAETPLQFDTIEEAGAEAFVADPPSTLISLLKRGPLQVDIYSVPVGPDPRAPKRSDTFPKIEVEGPRVQTFEEILASRKRRDPSSR